VTLNFSNTKARVKWTVTLNSAVYAQTTIYNGHFADMTR